MVNKKREFLLPLAELIDRLAIDHIKEVLIPEHKASFIKEMEKISHDIDSIISEKELKLTSRFIRVVIVLAQINLHIWRNKDLMQKDSERYAELLKLSHQLNGIRNQMKNLLLEETGDREKSAERTNFNTDGLQGWDFSVK